MGYKIGEEKELEIFLGTIEEASKHVRSLLFLLLLTSVYVVVAAYTGDWQTETLVLPILDAEISRRWFFIISPIFILFNYVYLHLFLKDAMRRWEIFFSLPFETTLIPKNYLTFPWFLPISEEDKNPATRSFGNRFVNFGVDIIFWWYGPFVLLIILMAYIFHNDAAALVPYVCFCLSIIHYVANSRFSKSKFTIFRLAYFSFLLLFITFSAIPSFAAIFGIAEIDDKTFIIIMRFLIKSYFIIYFTVFAIPGEWKSKRSKQRKIIWTLVYILGILFFSSDLFDVDVTLPSQRPPL